MATSKTDKLEKEIEELVPELTDSLSPVKMDIKRNRLADLLLKKLRLSRYGLNKEHLIDKTLDGGMDWYSPVPFVMAMKDALQHYDQKVPQEYPSFWNLFQTYYNTKNAGILVEKLRERDFETTAWKEEKIKEHLGSLMGVPSSEIRFEVLNRHKIEDKLREIYHLLSSECIPSEEKDFLDEIFSTPAMPSRDLCWQNEKGDVFEGTEEERKQSIEEYNIAEYEDDATDAAIAKILKLYDDYEDDEVLLGFVSYNILMMQNETNVDERLLKRIPEKMVQLFEQDQPGDLAGDRNIFLGKYFNLRPDTMRKKIDKIKLKLMAEQNSKF